VQAFVNKEEKKEVQKAQKSPINSEFKTIIFGDLIWRSSKSIQTQIQTGQLLVF